MANSIPKYLTDSGLIWTGHGSLTVLLIGGMDDTNDPQITVYNNTAGSGTPIVPTTPLDASVKGFNGFTKGEIKFTIGCYILVEAAGGGDFDPGTIQIVAAVEEGLKQ